jgi:hypothetical protein
MVLRNRQEGHVTNGSVPGGRGVTGATAAPGEADGGGGSNDGPGEAVFLFGCFQTKEDELMAATHERGGERK